MTTARDLVNAALAQVRSVAPEAAAAWLGRDDTLFVDLREAAELDREGSIPGALHAPRGLIEFLADPASPWHLPALAPGRSLVLFCGAGWRSALAARDLGALGRTEVCHIAGGFEAWRRAGLATTAPQARAFDQTAPQAQAQDQDQSVPQAPAPDLAALLRIQAHANRLANHRLHSAMRALPPAELHAPRTSFFPTLIGTLNHILAVDGYYLACLKGEPDADRHWHEFVPASDLPELQPRQHAMDDALIRFCSGLDAAGCVRGVAMPRAGGRIQRDLACHVLSHLFMHQTHHRGQVHAMLSGTAVKPPQLDEFLMPSEAHLRHEDVQAHGWNEAQIWGLAPKQPLLE